MICYHALRDTTMMHGGVYKRKNKGKVETVTTMTLKDSS